MEHDHSSKNRVLQCSTKVFSRRTLKKRVDFLKIAREGHKVVMPSLIIQASITKRDEEEIRIGFTATRKIGSSVIRNRARRRLRAVVDLIARERPLSAGDYVLIARRTTVTAPFEVLMRDFRKALANVS